MATGKILSACGRGYSGESSYYLKLNTSAYQSVWRFSPVFIHSCFVLFASGLFWGWDVDEFGDALPSCEKAASRSRGWHSKKDPSQYPPSHSASQTCGRLLVFLTMTGWRPPGILECRLNLYRCFPGVGAKFLGHKSRKVLVAECLWSSARPSPFFYTASPEKYLGSWSYSQWLDFSFRAMNWCTGMIWLVLCMLGLREICENMPSPSSQTYHIGVFTPLLSHNRGQGEE